MNIDEFSEGLKELAKISANHIPSDKVFEDTEKEVSAMLNQSNKLHKSLKMCHETFTREFDI